MKYAQVFTKPHTFLAVVHCESQDQALRNVAVARDNGADGAFLINHSIPSNTLLNIYDEVSQRFPGFWLGLNILDLYPIHALMAIPSGCRGMWTDNAGISDLGESPEARIFRNFRNTKSKWNGLYFGGVAFKHQRPVKDVAQVARMSTQFVDVVTTSGAATGISADVGKIRAMKQAIDDFPLAIASGITPENVEEYMEWADCFLVATGVSDSHTELNPRRVAMLAKALI